MQTVTVPSQFSNTPISGILKSDQNTDPHINQYKPTDDIFLSHIHTARTQTERGNVAHDSFTGVRVSEQGPRLNIKTVLSTYGDFHVKDKTAVRTSYL